MRLLQGHGVAQQVGRSGCDSCCEKKCHCQGFRPWNPPDVASSDIKRICVPCIASVLVDHTYFVREAFFTQVVQHVGAKGHSNQNATDQTKKSETKKDDWFYEEEWYEYCHLKTSIAI